MNKKIVIIGGVAGGATTAARLRRLDEFSEIILFEKGEYISFANCGLPYHIGGVIPSRDALVVQTPQDTISKFNIDVRIQSEVIDLNTKDKKIVIKDLKTNKTYEESYDKAIISTGAQPIMPPIEGIKDAKNLFKLRNIPDMDEIIEFIDESKPKKAVVIGGGFIGVEMMENLVHKGLDVTLVEMAPQVMGMFDYEMAQIIHQHIVENHVGLVLNDGVKAFQQNGKKILLSSGARLDADLIIFAIGVRPDNMVAKKGGLKLTKRGSIDVNENLQTSDPDVYAIGDVIDVKNLATKQVMNAALAGPANKQGRFVANHIYGISDSYQGTLATSAAKIFDLTVGSVGANQRTLKQLGMPFKSIHIHPMNHASYYPGSTSISLKVLYHPETLEIYGAQAIGGEGVDKRIDVLSTAIYAKLKVTDLKHLDLAYAPPFSSAKDPVNMVGFVAENIKNGLVDTISWQDMQELASKGAYLLDIRETPEYILDHLPGSFNIPLTELRSRISEIPRDQEIYVYCAVGIRGYAAARILKQHGFNVKNLDGGYKSYSCVFDQEGNEICFTLTDDFGMPVIDKKEAEKAIPIIDTKTISLTVDACGLQCPGPIVQVYKNMEQLKDGDILEVKATDPGFKKDIASWSSKTGNTLLNINEDAGVISAHIQKGQQQKQKQGYEVKETKDGTTIVVFSQDLDKAIAAFIIASGAASMGKKVSLFFTFWGLNILRKPKKVRRLKKTLIEKMFGKMMPRGSKKLPISNMNMMGMGPKMIKHIMKKKNVDSLQVLMKNAIDMDVKIIACAMSMDIMGIKKEELIEGIEVAGVATYLGDTQDANHNLFI